MKTIILALLLLICTFSFSASGAEKNMSVGVVDVSNSVLQVSTTKNNLNGDVILICSSVRKLCNSCLGYEFSITKPNESVEDVVFGRKIYTYALNKPKSKKLQSGISFAFIFNRGDIRASDVRFDGYRNVILKNNKVDSAISYCTSSEGVHVASNSGDMHLYYSLGYEIGANCSDEVYK